MERASSIDEFLAAPIGKFVVDRTFAFFFPHEALSGYLAWGRPTAFDFETLARLLPVMHAPEREPHAVLLDLRMMETLEPGAFALAVRYTIDHFAAFGRAITRIAMLRGSGVGGAIAAGFFRVAPRYCPIRVFTEAGKALEWLGRGPDHAWYETFCREIEATCGEPSLLDRLRAVLEVSPRISVDQAAAQLGTSPRTLQRRLGDEGTNFTNEAGRAQMRIAERLLLETQASLTEIAFAVGCKSTQHFSTLFRNMTGEAPSDWRTRRKSTTE